MFLQCLVEKVEEIGTLIHFGPISAGVKALADSGERPAQVFVKGYGWAATGVECSGYVAITNANDYLTVERKEIAK